MKDKRKGRGISVKKFNRIIDVAYATFPIRGYEATKMEAIARDAGVSKQTLFNRFGTKDKLFCEVIECVCRRHCPPEKLLQDKATPPDEALHAIGKGFLAMISDPKGIAFSKMVHNESQKQPQVGKFFFELGPMRMQQLLVDYLNLGVAKGIFEITQTSVAASHFFALLKGRFHLRIALNVKPAPSKKEIKSHIDETVSIFLKLYLSPKNTENTTRKKQTFAH